MSNDQQLKAQSNYLAIHMIHRNIKVTHRLPSMKITGKNAVCTSFCDKVCDKFGCNGFTTLCLQIKRKKQNSKYTQQEKIIV